MKQSQAEIKAIEAELKSIRAEKSPTRQPSPTHLAEASTAKPRSIKTPFTMLDSTQPSTQVQPSTQDHLAQTGYPQDKLAVPLGQLQLSQLQPRSAYTQQLNSAAHSTPEQRLSGVLQSLESQAQHINHLSAIQEAAILELKAIAEKVEQDWKAIELESAEPAEDLAIPSVCEYLTATVPKIEKNESGVLVLTTRSVDLFKAEREAALTAQALRHLVTRSKQPKQPARSIVQQLRRWLFDAAPPTQTLTPARRQLQFQPQPSAPAVERKPAIRKKSQPPSRTQARRASHRRSASQSDSPFTLREGLALLVGAVLVRAAVDLVVQAFPMLWLPSIAVLVMPAAIAVYRTTTTPPSGFAWGYRLFAIMIGLLLGGRL